MGRPHDTVEINGNYSPEMSWKRALLNRLYDKNAMQTLDQSSTSMHGSDRAGRWLRRFERLSIGAIEMNRKTVIISGLVAVLMVTCAVPFMASEDSDALTWNSNLNLNVTSAVIYVDANSADHTFTFTVVDAPAGTQANDIHWHFEDLEDGLNIAHFTGLDPYQTTGFSATVYANSVATGKTASSIEVVAYIDSTHYASAVVVVYPSESTTTTVFHYYFKVDQTAITYLLLNEDITYDDLAFDPPGESEIYAGFWVTVALEDTELDASDFNALSALEWYLTEEGWDNDIGSYGWINTLLGLGSYQGPDHYDNQNNYIGSTWYYWAQYHATGNGTSATWVFNNTTLEFITTVEESYIGLIFWGSPDANTVPTPFPGYPAA